MFQVLNTVLELEDQLDSGKVLVALVTMWNPKLCCVNCMFCVCVVCVCVSLGVFCVYVWLLAYIFVKSKREFFHAMYIHVYVFTSGQLFRLHLMNRDLWI